MRYHCNPPIWEEYHPHDFIVTIKLESRCNYGDLYGVDMVEAEKQLNQIINTIPAQINDLESCPNGTTEQLCVFFADNLTFCDPNIKLKEVIVGETPERLTCLIV